MGDGEKIQFPGADGTLLVGRVIRPAGATRGWALFAHCFTCSKDLRAAKRISLALANRGIASLRFDFTGLGESEGDFADTNFSSNVQDLVAAANYLRDTHAAPQLLVGHSLGGAAVLAAAHQVSEVRAVATIGAPFDPAHVADLFAPVKDELAEVGTANVSLGGRPFTIKQQFVEDLKQELQPARIAALKRALIVFHSPQDKIVGIENAGKIYQAARHPKSFVSLDGADHLLRRPADADYVAEVLSAWVGRYLCEEGATANDTSAEVIVTGGSSGFRQSVQMGKHRLIADEPASVGGDDTGPSPYDLLLAGLGACTSMTMRMYANRKGWPLERVSVQMNHRKVHAKDCDSCETQVGKIDHIDRTLRIEGPLDKDQLARLVAIADKCPVHRTLHSEVKIDTRLASDSED